MATKKMPAKLRLEMTEEEAVKVLHWLGKCSTDELLADVYYRLKEQVARRQPKRFDIHRRRWDLMREKAIAELEEGAR